jgi:hypothetical protein
VSLSGKAGLLYTFNELAGGTASSQFQTQLSLKHQATSSIWVGAGVNAHHALLRDATNKALMIFSGYSTQGNTNSATLSTGIPANTSGERFEVSFDVSPTVNSNSAQATRSGDRLVVRVVDESGFVLGQLAIAPGTWSGSNNFSKYSFAYIGSGSGAVKIVVTSSVATDRFSGAIDNLSIISKAEFVSAALSTTPSLGIARLNNVGSGSAFELPSALLSASTISVEGGPATYASTATDSQVGSGYRLMTRPGSLGSPREWWLEYLSGGSALLGREDLNATSDVLWRARNRAVALPSGGWLRVCESTVYTLQDGYQLLAGGRNRTLQPGWQSEIVVKGGAEAVLVTGASCSGESLVVSGYAFGVSADEPPLRDEPVAATSFKLKLDPTGRESARKSEARPISVGEICALPRSQELEGFCRAAEAALQ